MGLMFRAERWEECPAYRTVNWEYHCTSFMELKSMDPGSRLVQKVPRAGAMSRVPPKSKPHATLSSLVNIPLSRTTAEENTRQKEFRTMESNRLVDLAQPNFNLISENFRTASTELAKCANIPAIQHGEAIIRELREMRREMNARFDELGASIESTNVNGLARLRNAVINTPEARLSPLVTTRNQPVDSFPQNLAALKNLRDTPMTELLQAYSLPVHGTPGEKKRRLKQFIGIVVDLG